MSHQFGANIGGATSLNCIRNRCVIDHDTKCWHFRTASGRPMPKDRSHKVWVHGASAMSVPRATWAFHTGKPVPPGRVVSRVCGSYDCANPAHLRCWSKADEGEHHRKLGTFKGVTVRIAANTRNAIPLAKLTHELAQWARESSQTIVAVAHGLGISPSRVGYIRNGNAWRVAAPQSSVFARGKR